MAKETMIVFVYDTECCKDEADDPVKAVLYFHPSWVSDTQKLALCGQLMGTTYFLKDCFFKPKVISLQNGKFVLKEFGRFILAVGTDRNISDYLLEHRASLLSSLVNLFHRNLQTIFDQFAGSGQDKNLSEKLYHIFETYLPILQYNGNIFHNIPKLKIPKNGSTIFLEAIQTLQSCQQTKGVLGGAILYHNKVVATQLSDILTKNLVLTDPYRIKSTAEQISVEFHVPNGVQMLVIYIPNQEYRRLYSDAHRSQTLQTQPLANGGVPFQFAKRKVMKRDKSIIFTNIPEEESSAPPAEPVRPTKNLNRPTHLPLRFKNVTTRDIPESGFASINFDETDSYPQFIGRTSVCSTPMTENKVLHGDIMSICANPPEEEVPKEEVKKTSKKIDFEKFFSNFISNPNKMQRRNSFTDLQDSLKKLSKRFSKKPFAKVDINKNSDASPEENELESRTIADPMYPVFNSDGQPISKSLFQDFVEKYYSSWDKSTEKDEQIAKLIEEFKEFDSELKKLDSEPRTEINKNVTTENEKNIKEIAKTPMDRKGLSLPLKPLNDETSAQNSCVPNGLGGFERKKMSGIQLTPLIAKLSILALDEQRSSGFASWDTTPGIELPTPIDAGGNRLMRRKSSVKVEDVTEVDAVNGGLQKVELYVCGQQNMTLLLLLEEGAGSKEEIVKEMFEVCVARLTRMETHLNQTLNVNVESEKSEGGYSFFCMDPNWDTLQRGGPWTPLDLNSLEHMHSDFSMPYPITDMILRTNDSVLYGNKTGRTEVFYKESAHQNSGIPPPSDPMGTVSMRCKKRLERDHSYVLF